ncbi:class I SAM-dependent methyltransferase [Pseudonocardia hispaniensis]|uniref:Class I SAM-dependent methyltransferase n=1 Tax=Pseudonocardia hispaniensis TaxID=904933 RepID=A0ABW1J2G5_9PSEU
MAEDFSTAYWEQHWAKAYRDHADAVRERAPNPQLVAVAGDLTPGTALDAGCGHGADAVWLASHGWRVMAVDVSTVALRHAREHAESLGTDVAGRIDWLPADLGTWTPTEEQFDLVSTHYVHGVEPRALFRRLAAAVAPGGTLLIVGHDPSDPHTSHVCAPDVHVTAGQVATLLDPDRWDILVAEARARPATDHHGDRAPAIDAVLCARRHAAASNAEFP